MADRSNNSSAVLTKLYYYRLVGERKFLLCSVLLRSLDGIYTDACCNSWQTKTLKA